MTEPNRASLAESIEVVQGRPHVRLRDGRLIDIPLTPRLRAASPQQRLDARVTGSGTQIRWPALDEDLAVAHLIGVTEEDLYRLAGATIVPRQLGLFDAPTAAATAVNKVPSVTSVVGLVRIELARVGGLQRQPIELRNGATAASRRAPSTTLESDFVMVPPTSGARRARAAVGS